MQTRASLFEEISLEVLAIGITHDSELRTSIDGERDLLFTAQVVPGRLARSVVPAATIPKSLPF